MFGQDVTEPDGILAGVERVRIRIPIPETKTAAKQILAVCLKRAEAIYTDELTGGYPAGLRKGMRSPGKSTLELAQRIASAHGLPIPPDARPFRAELKRKLKRA
jgi:hypothetical protein